MIRRFRWGIYCALFLILQLVLSPIASLAADEIPVGGVEPSSERFNKEGAALVKSGNMEEAIFRFNKALELDPSHTGARFNLAFTYQRMGRLKEAEDEYLKALEIRDLTRAHFMLGLLYEKQGKYSHAIHEYETALRKEPDNKVASARLEILRNKVAIEIAELDKIAELERIAELKKRAELEKKAKRGRTELEKKAELGRAELEKKAELEKTVETEDEKEVIEEGVVPEKPNLAALFGKSEISVLADVSGQFVDSMAKHQVLEGEFASQVGKTSLLESIRTGRTFNRDSLAALARTVQAKAQTGQAKALLMPSVSMRISHGEEKSEPGAVVDPVTQQLVASDTHLRSDATLTVRQPLFNLPTFLDWRRRIVKEQAREESYRVSDGDAYLSTVDTYLSLVSSRLLADVMRDFEAQLAELLSYIEKRASAGAASVSDMSRVRARSQATLSSRLEQESAHLAAGTEFVRLTNLVPQKVHLPKLEDVGISLLPESFEVAVTTAMQSNPEIATLSAELQAEKIERSVAKGRYLPRIDAEYTDTWSEGVGGNSASQRDRRLMLVMNWDIFSGGKNARYYDERTARHRELQYRLDDQRRRVVQALAANYSTLTTTSERITSGYQELESISIAAEAMSKRMLSGNQSLLDLLTVYDRYSQIRSRLINLHILEMNTVAQLIRLTLGTPWPTPEEDTPATKRLRLLLKTEQHS